MDISFQATLDEDVMQVFLFGTIATIQVQSISENVGSVVSPLAWKLETLHNETGVFALYD
jgi:hypothetical protein